MTEREYDMLYCITDSLKVLEKSLDTIKLMHTFTLKVLTEDVFDYKPMVTQINRDIEMLNAGVTRINTRTKTLKTQIEREE